ncbi:MAG: 2-dehydropantoate 2-reductase [Gammaproteobacteria bacterium]|nr:2-dehydropantoate 2-reductase [Gammaproteobacteria bacterium]
MKIAIYGAGAIGGYLGAMLKEAGADVSLIARGPHLAAIRANGLALKIGDKTIVNHPQATDDPRELGEQDYVIVALKAHSVPNVVGQMQPLLGEDTAVVTAVNGVPWWYFYELDGSWGERQLQSVDPGGKQWRGIGPERAIGCVVYPACEITEPGVIEHISGNRFSLGEPNGEKTERVQLLSKTLADAGLRAPIRKIRDELWVKLWGNLTFNPLSALTHATLDVVATDPGTKSVARNMMAEAQQIGEKLGVRFPVDIEKRISGAAAVGKHTTSMLQDLQLGRPMEIDALLTAVQELGRITEINTPTIDTVLPIIAQRARVAGCY